MLHLLMRLDPLAKPKVTVGFGAARIEFACLFLQGRMSCPGCDSRQHDRPSVFFASPVKTQPEQGRHSDRQDAEVRRSRL